MMFEYVQFLHGIFSDIKGKEERRKLLRSLILSEARFNNDLCEVILRSGADDVAKAKPLLFQQLRTDSIDLLTALGEAPHTVFNEAKDPSESDLKELEGSKRKLGDYKDRPQSDLYEFYIRKCSLLRSLSEADSLSELKISLGSRLRNIEHATRYISKKLSND